MIDDLHGQLRCKIVAEGTQSRDLLIRVLRLRKMRNCVLLDDFALVPVGVAIDVRFQDGVLSYQVTLLLEFYN